MSYKTRVAMIVTEKQFKKDLKQQLEQLGKNDNTWGDWSKDKYLTADYNGFLGNYSRGTLCGDNLIILSDYNPKLFLALAAMTDDDEGGIGEYWKFIGNGTYSGDKFTHDKLYKQRLPSIKNAGAFEDNLGEPNGFNTNFSTNGNYETFIKATKEEIIATFENKIQDIKMKNRILTPLNAARIINIACSAWKKILAEKWAVDMILDKNIEISDEFYKEMRKACTAPQNELFDDIFGSDEQFIDVSELVIGESMKIYDANGATKFEGIIVMRIWAEDGEFKYVDVNNPRNTWCISPKFKGKKVKLTITHEEVK
jgi:hypothetical protein